MTTVYVNGKLVTKEEIKKIEIHNDKIKRILAGKLEKNSDKKEG